MRKRMALSAVQQSNFAVREGSSGDGAQPSGRGHLMILLILLLMLFVQAQVGRAQSAMDGFDPGSDGTVHSLAVQADGKILVGGDFTQLAGQLSKRIARLKVDGMIDSSFASFNPGANSIVRVITVQADGKILVGGDFTQLGGQPRNRIGRLNADGTLDSSFDPGADGEVNALAVQADGKILLGGSFTQVGGQLRNRIARLNATARWTRALIRGRATVSSPSRCKRMGKF